MNQDGWWWRLVHLEPTMLRTFIVAVATLLGAFGMSIAPDKVDAIIGLASVALIVLGGISTRGAVTANARVVVEAPDPIGAPGTVVPGEATTEATNKEIIDAATDVPRG